MGVSVSGDRGTHTGKDEDGKDEGKGGTLCNRVGNVHTHVIATGFANGGFMTSFLGLMLLVVGGGSWPPRPPVPCGLLVPSQQAGTSTDANLHRGGASDVPPWQTGTSLLTTGECRASPGQRRVGHWKQLSPRHWHLAGGARASARFGFKMRLEDNECGNTVLDDLAIGKAHHPDNVLVCGDDPRRIFTCLRGKRAVSWTTFEFLGRMIPRDEHGPGVDGGHLSFSQVGSKLRRHQQQQQQRREEAWPNHLLFCICFFGIWPPPVCNWSRIKIVEWQWKEM